MITVPIWPEFVLPVLQVLSDGQTRTSRAIRTAAFDLMTLDDEARAEVLPGGESRAHNRAGWAITHVHRADWIERVSRGSYRITEAGQAALRTHANGFHDYASAGAVLDKYWKTPESPVDTPQPVPAPSAGDPVEQIESAVSELNQAVAVDLLERLRGSHPDFFEEAVVKVLLAMGYGGAEQRGKRIGGTGDGGVDGVIDQDALGLDQIYIQAKRYAEGKTIGGETIQAFVGAVLQKGASRGVFITTSSFTPAAKAAAASHHVRIALIDGLRLASLMIQYRVGVQTRQTYEVVELDEDFFE